VERNTTAISEVDKGVRAISEATLASCTKVPCWTLRDFVSSQTLGKAKDLIDSKVAPGTRKENGQFIYEINGCLVRLEYTDAAVTYLSANLFKYVKIEGQKKQVWRPTS